MRSQPEEVGHKTSPNRDTETDLFSRYGPPSTTDTPWQARMRFHQSWYRATVLNEPDYGIGPTPRSRIRYGSMLNDTAATKGLNFLSGEIHRVARYRAASGPGVEWFRCSRNMLSSQPMAFNLFGPLVRDSDLATRLMRSLLGDRAVRVEEVLIEWAPTPRTQFLGDGTSFDVLLRLSGPQVQIIGVEVKLTEPFSAPREAELARTNYMQLTADRPEVWEKERLASVGHPRWRQLWRNHLLVDLYGRTSSHAKGSGRIAVVFHPRDPECRSSIEGYAETLVDDSAMLRWDLETVVSTWESIGNLRHDDAWLTEFRRRYLSLNSSEAEWRRYAIVARLQAS